MIWSVCLNFNSVRIGLTLRFAVGFLEKWKESNSDFVRYSNPTRVHSYVDLRRINTNDRIFV